MTDTLPHIYYIYALRDPIDNQVRYIGSSENPWQRYRQHIYCKSGTKRYRKWLDGLKQDGHRPVLEIIEKIESFSWGQREWIWIDYYGLDNLVNTCRVYPESFNTPCRINDTRVVALQQLSPIITDELVRKFTDTYSWRPHLFTYRELDSNTPLHLRTTSGKANYEYTWSEPYATQRRTKG